MKTHFLTDDAGKRVAAVVPIDDYERMLEELEDLEDVRLYDEAKKVPSDAIPAKEAFDYLDKKRAGN